MSATMDVALTREDADIRDALIASGVATPEELDAAGWPSHDQLDAAQEDGTLTEAVVGLWKEVLHPRSRGGKFASKPGTLPTPKARGGGTVPGAEHAPQQVPQQVPQQAAQEAEKSAAKTKRYEPSPEEKAAIARIESLDDVKAQLEEVSKHALNDWPTKGPGAQKVLGDAVDSRELHTVALPASPGTEGQEPQRAYTAERKKLHDKVVGGFLTPAVAALLGENHPISRKLANGRTLSPEEKDVVRQAASKARGGEGPRALFMAGGPASGKTSALKASPELEPDAAVQINPDDLKAKLPEYHGMVGARDRYAANGVHEESSDLAKRLQDEAVDLGLNAVVDGTGNSKRGKFAGKMRAMHEAGYGVSGLYVTIPTDTAVVRATKRAMKSGRWVPEPELRAQHRNVSANFVDVADLPFVRDLKVYDNSGDAPQLIASGGGGRLNIHQQEAHTRFLGKAAE